MKVADIYGASINVGANIVFATAHRRVHGKGVLRTGTVTKINDSGKISVRLHTLNDLGGRNHIYYSMPATGRVVTLKNASAIIRW